MSPPPPLRTPSTSSGRNRTSELVADEFKPALLEVTETEPGWYTVTWKVPLQNGRPLKLTPRMPPNLDQVVQRVLVREQAVTRLPT